MDYFIIKSILQDGHEDVDNQCKEYRFLSEVFCDPEFIVRLQETDKLDQSLK